MEYKLVLCLLLLTPQKEDANLEVGNKLKTLESAGVISFITRSMLLPVI